MGINLGLIVAVWLCSKIIGFIGSLFSKDMNNSDIGWYAEHISVSLNHYYWHFQQLSSDFPVLRDLLDSDQSDNGSVVLRHRRRLLSMPQNQGAAAYSVPVSFVFFKLLF